jgi:hypothetical protein
MQQYIFLKKYKKISCLVVLLLVILYDSASGQLVIGNNLGTHKATQSLDMNTKSINNIGSVLYGSLAVTDRLSGGSIGSNTTTVDINSYFNVNQTTANQILTLPTPSNINAGRMVIVSNIGSTSFTMHGTIIGIGQQSMFMYNGTAWTPLSNAASGTTVPISGLTAAVATNTIFNGDYPQTWNWNSSTTINPFSIASNTLSSGNLVNISSTSTAAASNTQTLLNIGASGTNAASGQTTYGAQIANSHGGSGTNIALQVSASGGSTNYAMKATGDVKATRYLSTNGNTYTYNFSSGSTLNIDLSTGNYIAINFNWIGPVTINLLNSNGPASYVFKLINGPFNPTINWPSNFRWSNGGSAPTWNNLASPGQLAFTINRTDIINIFFDGTYYYCSLSINYLP